MTSQAQFVSPDVIPTGQPQVSVSTRASNRREKRKKVLFVLGIAEVVMGSLSILFAIASIAIGKVQELGYIKSTKNLWADPPSQPSFGSSRSSGNILGISPGFGYNPFPASAAAAHLTLTYSSQGIWGGLLTLITGVLGIRAKITPTKWFFITNIIMAAITATLVFVAFIMSVYAAVSVSLFSPALTGLHSAISLFTFVSLVLTIVHVVFGCCGVCCINSGLIRPKVYIPQPFQYMQGPDGQFVMVTNLASPPMNAPQLMQPHSQIINSAYSSRGEQQNMNLRPGYQQQPGQIQQA